MDGLQGPSSVNMLTSGTTEIPFINQIYFKQQQIHDRATVSVARVTYF